MSTAPPACARSLSNASGRPPALGDSATHGSPEPRRGSDPTLPPPRTGLERPVLPQSNSAPSIATAHVSDTVRRAGSFRSSHVTQGRANQACQRCRKARTKCSGTQPCERCTEKKFDCEYTMQARHSFTQSAAKNITEAKPKVPSTQTADERPSRQHAGPTKVASSSQRSASVAHRPIPGLTRGLARNRSSTLPSHKRALPYPPTFIRRDVSNNPNIAPDYVYQVDRDGSRTTRGVCAESGYRLMPIGISPFQGWREPIYNERPRTGSSETSLGSDAIAPRFARLSLPAPLHVSILDPRSVAARQRQALHAAVEDWRQEQPGIVTYDEQHLRMGSSRDGMTPSHLHFIPHERPPATVVDYYVKPRLALSTSTQMSTGDFAHGHHRLPFSPLEAEDAARVLAGASLYQPRGRERAYTLPALKLRSPTRSAEHDAETLPSFSELLRDLSFR